MPRSNEARSQQHPEETIGEALARVRNALGVAGIPDASIEAEFLLAHSLGLSTTGVYARGNEPVPAKDVTNLQRNLTRRLNREPLAYIRGAQEFYGRTFTVDRRALIPRPETEILVERALEFAEGGVSGPLRIADVGTGSGVLAITLALELPSAEVHAVDASAEALGVAKLNAARLGVASRVRWSLGDLTAPLAGRFHVIVGNLPYVRTGDLSHRQPELAHEPQDALDGGPDGMRYIGPLIEKLPRLLARPGIALLEIDPPISSAAVVTARKALSKARVAVHKDLAGLDRCLEVRVP